MNSIAARRDLTGWPVALALAVGLLIPLTAYAYPVAVLVAIGIGVWLARKRPAVLVAVAVNGFFVYLGVLDAGGRTPHTRTTAPYDAVLGLLLIGVAVARRRRLAARLKQADGWARVWIVAAASLGVWLLANGVLFRGGGSEAARLLGLFVFVTAPAALAALTFDSIDTRLFQRTLVGLGVVMLVIDAVAAITGANLVEERIAPISGLDPISTAIVTAVAGAALLGWRAGSRAEEAARLGLFGAMLAATLAEGSRGPAVALVGAAVLVALVDRRTSIAPAAVAAVAGIMVGVVAADAVGTSRYLERGAHDVGHLVRGPSKPAAHPPAQSAPRPPAAAISTFHLRREWLRLALSHWTEKPVFGHGIATLPNTTPEARTLGTYGSLIYPHNDFAEALYSLGLVGLVLFVGFVMAAFVVSARRARLREGRCEGVAFALFAYFFFESNFSGEIGADTGLWVAAALALALSARRAAQP